jgi:hypothetical protein
VGRRSEEEPNCERNQRCSEKVHTKISGVSAAVLLQKNALFIICTSKKSHNITTNINITKIMSVGIAFSGGGIPAAISAACAWNAIVETHPSILMPPHAEKVTVSTVSGGR